MKNSFITAISIHTPTKGVTDRRNNKQKNWWFQSTLPRREWPLARAAGLSLEDFNPHSHEGSDLVRSFFHLQQLYFNPHSHEGSDRGAGGCILLGKNFNPHSHEGSDWADSVDWFANQNFNPHSHEGSDIMERRTWRQYVISIHTPTKGVTSGSYAGRDRQTISIHTPTKGVTVEQGGQIGWLYDFNPHSHEGSDEKVNNQLAVKTHFNPHSHEGSDGGW